MAEGSVDVTIFSRQGCHLCDVAEELLVQLQSEHNFALTKIFIDGDSKLEYQYGEQVPVITINGKVHDFFRVDPKRFTAALAAIKEF